MILILKLTRAMYRGYFESVLVVSSVFGHHFFLLPSFFANHEFKINMNSQNSKYFIECIVNVEQIGLFI